MSSILQTTAASQQKTVTVSGQAINGADVASPVDAGVRFGLDGNVFEDENAGFVQIDVVTNWFRPLTLLVGTEYEIRATEQAQSGTATRTGTLNTWQTLDVNRDWNLQRALTGTATWDLLMEIRDAVTLIVLDSATYNLDAEVIP